jgi:hypothetical protein
VADCDVFLGIIRGAYGSGRAQGDKSITHHEISKAIALNKPRFFAVEQKVDNARQILRPLVKKNAKGNPEWGNPEWAYSDSIFKHNPIIDDLRLL